MGMNKRFYLLFNELAFDYDRLSKSGQEAYCEMQKILGLITEEEMQMALDYEKKNKTLNRLGDIKNESVDTTNRLFRFT
jgi:hypothetical protein